MPKLTLIPVLGLIVFGIIAVVAVVVFINMDNDTPGSPAETTTPGTVEPSPVPGGADEAVQVTNFAFAPERVEVSLGGTVAFTNASLSRHAIKVGDAEDVPLGSGESMTWEAQEPGTFPIVCTMHPNEMTGEVTVLEP